VVSKLLLSAALLVSNHKIFVIVCQFVRRSSICLWNIEECSLLPLILQKDHELDHMKRANGTCRGKKYLPSFNFRFPNINLSKVVLSHKFHDNVYFDTLTNQVLRVPPNLLEV